LLRLSSTSPVHRESLGNAGGRMRNIYCHDDRPALSGGVRNADLSGRRRTCSQDISLSSTVPQSVVCARDLIQAVDVNQVELLHRQSGEPCHAMQQTLVCPRGFMVNRACAYMENEMFGDDLSVFERVNCLLKTFKPHMRRWCG
jgi:hypothetical protein